MWGEGPQGRGVAPTSALRRRLAAALLGAGALRAAGRAQLPQGGVSVLDARAHPFWVQLTWGTSESFNKVLVSAIPQDTEEQVSTHTQPCSP